MKKKQLLLKTVFILCIFAVISVFPATVSAAVDESPAVTTVSTEKTEKKSSSDLVKDILIALGISVAVTGITVFLIAHSYKTNGKSEPYPYNKKAPLSLTRSEDDHIDTRLEKRRKEKNDNN